MADVEAVEECCDRKSVVDVMRVFNGGWIIADVQMTRLDAFEMLEQLDPSERPLLILITSNDQYAVRAFEAGVVDYLLKPVTNHRLSLALERAVRATARSHTGYLTHQVEQLLD